MTERNSTVPEPLRSILNMASPAVAPAPVNDDEPMEERKAPPAPFWTVAIYLSDRAYGGPEEGGWYYDCGERVDHALDDVPPELIFHSFASPNAAVLAGRFAEALQTILDKGPNKGRREISSVLSTGRYVAHVYNGHPPTHYPERRPHYE